MMKKAIILCLLTAAIASAQTKQRIAVLPSVGDLDPQRLILLTDKVRELATQHLPMEGFNILKQDVITKMIGEEELYRACKEGVCIGDLAKKTNADFGARCDVVELGGELVLKFEIYSVNEEAIFETFTDYDVKDFRGMLALLEARLPETFKKVIASAKADAKAAAVAAATAAATTAPQPEPKQKAKLAISAGGGLLLTNAIGGGVEWESNAQKTEMPYAGIGAFLFFDAVYAEAFAGFSTGGGKWKFSGGAEVDNGAPDMPRTYINIGAFAKYPFTAGAVKLFPLVGVDYEASVSGKLVYADGMEYAFDGGGDGDGRYPADALSALWVKFGGGADLGLGEILYLRAEFLYGFRTANGFEKKEAEADAYSDKKTIPASGLTLKVGVGFRL